MPDPQPDIEILDRSECVRLLRTMTFGRLAYSSAALPAVQPVNFVVHGDTIIVRTTSESKLAAATRHSVVAFETDRIDEHTRAGWSVTVVGRSSHVTDQSVLEELTQEGPEAWGNPRGDRFVAIRIEQINGRWLHSPIVTIR